MIFIREFEFYESENCMLATPCDMEGGTFGKDLQDAVAMAVDWLEGAAQYALINDKPLEGGKFGHGPVHGGKIIAVSVNCDLNRIDAVTAADAARMLGVSTARVAQMCESGQLTSWRDGTKRMVLRDSVNVRLAQHPKPGRPRKSAALAAL